MTVEHAEDIDDSLGDLELSQDLLLKIASGKVPLEQLKLIADKVPAEVLQQAIDYIQKSDRSKVTDTRQISDSVSNERKVTNQNTRSSKDCQSKPLFDRNDKRIKMTKAQTKKSYKKKMTVSKQTPKATFAATKVFTQSTRFGISGQSEYMCDRNVEKIAKMSPVGLKRKREQEDTNESKVIHRHYFAIVFKL